MTGAIVVAQFIGLVPSPLMGEGQGEGVFPRPLTPSRQGRENYSRSNLRAEGYVGRGFIPRRIEAAYKMPPYKVDRDP